MLNQLDDDGLFKESLESLSSYFHVNIHEIKRILKIIQHADPIGVGCSSPLEAIQVQLRELNEAMILFSNYNR